MANNNASPTLNDVVFSGDSVTAAVAWGGAIYNVETSTINISHGSFYGNTSDKDAADAAYGVDVWQTMTTDYDGALDTTPVDMGVHYLP